MRTNNINRDAALIGVSSPKQVTLLVLAALNAGKISRAVDQFDEHFKFTDHALGLEFVDKRRLIEFFHKSRELFPDAMVEADATFEYGDHATVEWKRRSTQVLSYGSLQRRVSIFL
jgi:SnoaL-like domain